MARSRPGHRGRRPRRPLSLRPLPVDRPRRAGRFARRVGDPGSVGCEHRAHPARDDGLARHVPSRGGTRKERRHRRPRFERPRRARDRRRLVRGRARDVRVSVRYDAHAARRARPAACRDHAPAHRRRRRSPAARAAAETADHRRRPSQAAHGERCDPLRRRVQHRLPERRGGSRTVPHSRRRRAGGRPRRRFASR